MSRSHAALDHFRRARQIGQRDVAMRRAEHGPDLPYFVPVAGRDDEGLHAADDARPARVWELERGCE